MELGTKHLTYLRESENIKLVVDTPPTPPSPRARRPVLNVNTSPTSPQFNRIARPPNIPGDDEPSPSSSDENPPKTTLPRRKSKPKLRLSSKLPLPTRGPSPTLSISQPPVSCSMEAPITSNPLKRRPSRGGGQYIVWFSVLPDEPKSPLEVLPWAFDSQH
jgi:hypothetical protein